MRAPSWMYRRRYDVTHGRTGFKMSVFDRWLPGVATEAAVNAVLAALGHPCCGRGLGRIPGVDVAAFTVLNWPNRLMRRDKRVLELPLTEAQALTLEPSWAENRWWDYLDPDEQLVRCTADHHDHQDDHGAEHEGGAAGHSSIPPR